MEAHHQPEASEQTLHQTTEVQDEDPIILTLQKGMWTTKIDLKITYLHIPIHPEDRRYLAFRYREEVDYQFVPLPFGLSTARRVFTGVTRAILAHLRKRGITLFAYLDDWLIIAGFEEAATRDTYTPVSLLKGLGWIRNRGKSSLEPKQLIIYLGALLDLKVRRASNRVSPAGSQSQLEPGSNSWG